MIGVLIELGHYGILLLYGISDFILKKRFSG